MIHARGLLLAIAYTASCLTGLKIKNTGITEYINRLKLEGKPCTTAFSKSRSLFALQIGERLSQLANFESI